MSDELASIPIRSLRKWFRQKRRPLPWRQNRSLYRVLVAEVMLQQTQVVTVIPYYLRWMERFPDPASLLLVSDEALVKFWEGLGYYGRVRRLRLAALALLSRPEWDEASLKCLPGIGPYTAAACACFALRQEGAIPLDGNMARLLVRFWGIWKDIKSSSVRKSLQQLLARHLSKHQICPDDMEALIELGALVCQPKSPRCIECPLNKRCVAYQQGLVQKLPISQKKKPFELFQRAAIVLYERGFFWICPAERVKGLWEFPSFPYVDELKLEEELRLKGIQTFAMQCPPITYQVTRFRTRLIGFLLVERENLEILAHWQRVTWKEIQEKPFSSGHKKLLHMALNFFGGLDLILK
ncbi:A/G-specific adenine glycosylase [Candidatus Similichlamydia laticola]|uniref:A/G-specific adenine glycosylase n=1 Tax=Candidatus Similichlamydia laticola TaxID=2170265 RepID=A0A369KB84_9BACT|nr:A/G-specific adenine glycosylase [Candidatus Similichlamydia laticola]RDB31178.1 A/G-specific adenine glycosylase [Candidatus Similichlamydia laticola]